VPDPLVSVRSGLTMAYDTKGNEVVGPIVLLIVIDVVDGMYPTILLDSAYLANIVVSSPNLFPQSIIELQAIRFKGDAAHPSWIIGATDIFGLALPRAKPVWPCGAGSEPSSTKITVHQDPRVSMGIGASDRTKPTVSAFQKGWLGLEDCAAVFTCRLDSSVPSGNFGAGIGSGTGAGTELLLGGFWDFEDLAAGKALPVHPGHPRWAVEGIPAFPRAEASPSLLNVVRTSRKGLTTSLTYPFDPVPVCQVLDLGTVP